MDGVERIGLFRGSRELDEAGWYQGKIKGTRRTAEAAANEPDKEKAQAKALLDTGYVHTEERRRQKSDLAQYCWKLHAEV